MTRILKTILIVASLCFAVTANAGEAEDAIAAAKAAPKSAAMVGGEWRDTKKMIKKAEKLLTDGKTEQAIKQAMKAEAQGMLGHMQATMQDLHI